MLLILPFRKLAKIGGGNQITAYRRGEDFVRDIAGIEHAGRLEAKDLGFFVGAGACRIAARHGHAFARPIATTRPFHQEEFVLWGVDGPRYPDTTRGWWVASVN